MATLNLDIVTNEINRYVNAAQQLLLNNKQEFTNLSQNKHIMMWRIAYLMNRLENLDKENLNKLQQSKIYSREALDSLACELLKDGIRPQNCVYFTKSAESLFLKAHALNDSAFIYRYAQTNDKLKDNRKSFFKGMIVFFVALPLVLFSSLAILSLTGALGGVFTPLILLGVFLLSFLATGAAVTALVHKFPLKNADLMKKLYHEANDSDLEASLAIKPLYMSKEEIKQKKAIDKTYIKPDLSIMEKRDRELVKDTKTRVKLGIFGSNFKVLDSSDLNNQDLEPSSNRI